MNLASLWVTVLHLAASSPCPDVSALTRPLVTAHENCFSNCSLCSTVNSLVLNYLFTSDVNQSITSLCADSDAYACALTTGAAPCEGLLVEAENFLSLSLPRTPTAATAFCNRYTTTTATTVTTTTRTTTIDSFGEQPSQIAGSRRMLAGSGILLVSVGLMG
ncbi:unnamed protein product [Effrenium voratum]|nr:unnamed protein product [Effrenium voratum]